MSSEQTPRRPNILFFFADDQRFDTLAALGNDEIHTPNLDALVERGTTFTRAHIMGGTCPAVCMPSRAMLMSGRGLFTIHGQGQSIPPEHVTMPEALRQAGYQTYGIGKWHNGAESYARSFSDGGEIYFGGMADHWNVPACSFQPSGEYPADRPICPSPGKSNELKYDPCDHISPGTHSTELFCDAAIGLLSKHDSAAPFFMYVSFLAPHDPRTTLAKYHDMYDPAAIRLPENYLPGHPFDNGELYIRDEMLANFPRTESETRRHIAEYYAMITHVDNEMGRVLKALEESGQADNTVIIFAGDNGLAVGRHGLMGKQNLYEHSVRVPLIFAGPGIEAGRRSDTFCYLSDIFPTVCDLADVETPGSVEGESLLPVIHGEKDTLRETVFYAYRDFQRGVCDGRWKLLMYNVGGTITEQLFDLEDDPAELHDLAGDASHGPAMERLRELMRDWIARTGDRVNIDSADWSAQDVG